MDASDNIPNGINLICTFPNVYENGTDIERIVISNYKCQNVPSYTIVLHSHKRKPM